MRSRVVNSKRADLSRGVRRKIERDNCEVLTGNLRGWNKPEYNRGEGRIVRGFFGHTRFATSSKATFEGTHPHQWCPPRVFSVYHFGSSSVAVGARNGPRRVGVENYITHSKYLLSISCHSSIKHAMSNFLSQLHQMATLNS